ncbi:unnamed protein product [Acanthoscelides obtectus]|uniref:non-specific serine/threonine protein kinase n=1 Tax=Acanthoscelides obtectus TaxID=200917 RepID=A0A9P0LT76_ACAOB|nr:unnamed protein product [Acanthoscelides obtectus]CAK1681723.1 Nucleosomal histone kinase 1 [Acanthoscelides obtectus]
MAKAKAAPKRKAATGYKLAEHIPAGEILQDISKTKWKLGPSIGHGGFGEIYSAQDYSKGGSKYPFVIKIEPHENGPLFVEMHFYMRNARSSDIDQFKKDHNLKTFGMPIYYGSGSHEYKGVKYRFLVMEKFGADIWKKFLENNRIFPKSTVFKIAIQILDVLEYIHIKGYVHADIKGANILLAETKETQNKQVYLVDFGLATKYTTEPVFKPNPKKAHDGTIEYLSRDAHQGVVPTRRGDLEILAYNLIHWLGGSLPWDKKLSDPKIVQKSKEEFIDAISKSAKSCFGNKAPPGPLIDYLNYLKTLDFNSTPDYKKIRKIFLSGIDSNDKLDAPLKFSETMKPGAKRKSREVSPLKSKSPIVRMAERTGMRSSKNVDYTNGDQATDSENSDIISGSEDELPTVKPSKRGRTKNDVSVTENGAIENADTATPIKSSKGRKRTQKVVQENGDAEKTVKGENVKSVIEMVKPRTRKTKRWKKMMVCKGGPKQ